MISASQLPEQGTDGPSVRSDVQRAILAVLTDGPATLQGITRTVRASDEGDYAEQTIKSATAALYTHRLIDRYQQGMGPRAGYIYRLAQPRQSPYIDALNRPRPSVDPLPVDSRRSADAPDRPEDRRTHMLSWARDVDPLTGKRKPRTYPDATALLIPVIGGEWRVFVKLPGSEEMHFVGRALTLARAKYKMYRLLEERYI